WRHRLSANLCQRQHSNGISVRRALHVRAVHPVLLLGSALRATSARAWSAWPRSGRPTRMSLHRSRRETPTKCNERTEIRVAPHEAWYKYGVAVLLLEIAVAIAVSGYSLYMSLNGLRGFPGNH